MMIKSLLQSYSKQWYVHSCGDGQSTGCCLLSLSTLPAAYNDDSHSHIINLRPSVCLSVCKCVTLL